MSGLTSTNNQSRATLGQDVRSTLRSGQRPLLFDISNLDLTKVVFTRKDLERWNPHRGQMALVDSVLWHSPDYRQGVAVKHIREDEFWVPGHFPGHPLFPGVLMIEFGAQVSVFLYNIRMPRPRVSAFTRIEEASFRAPVVPGDDLYVLCKEVKMSPRRFISDIQGLVNGKLAFEARITGVSLEEMKQ